MIPAFRLAEKRFGREAATFAAALTCFHPQLVMTSADALSEGPFTLALASLVLLGVRFSTVEDRRSDLVLGLVFGFAYLLRPEAAGYLGVFAFTKLWPGIRGMLRKEGMARLISLSGRSLFLAAGFLAVSLPYMAFLRMESGNWKVSSKTMLNLLVHDVTERGTPVDYEARRYGLSTDGQRLQIELESEGSAWRFLWGGRSRILMKYGRNCVDLVLKTFPVVFQPVLLILAFLGVVAVAGSEERRIDSYFGSWFVFPMLVFPVFWIEPRYYVPLVPIVLIWGAGGLVILTRGLVQPSRAPWFGSFLGRRGASALIMTVALTSLMFPTLKFLRASPWEYPLEHKAAGEWLKAHGRQHPTVMNRKSFVGFYSGGIPVPTPYGSLDGILKHARFRQVDYLVVDERFTVPTRPSLATLMDPSLAPSGFRPVYSNRESPGRGIVVYDIKSVESEADGRESVLPIHRP